MNFTERFQICVNEFTQEAVEKFAYHLGFEYLHGVKPEQKKEKYLYFNRTPFKIEYSYNKQDKNDSREPTNLIGLDKFFHLEDFILCNSISKRFRIYSDAVHYNEHSILLSDLKKIYNSAKNLESFYIKSYSPELNNLINKKANELGYFLTSNNSNIPHNLYLFKSGWCKGYNKSSFNPDGIKEYTLNHFFELKKEERKFKIGFNDVTINDNEVKIGCKYFSRNELELVYSAAKQFMI